MVFSREYLAQYIYLESQIKRMKRKLEYYESHPLVTEHGVVKGSMKNFPFAECHFVVSAPRVKSDEERKNAISQLIIDLSGNIRLYKDMKMDIECFIETLPDLEMKEILTMKYIDRINDSEIGKELGYHRSTICKKIDALIDLLS